MEFTGLAGPRVQQTQTRRVQCLPVQHPGVGVATPAVHRVTNQRQLAMLHVHANLMRAPGFQFDPQQGVLGEALLNPEMGDRMTPALPDLITSAVARVAGNRLIDGAPCDHFAPDQGQVLALDFPLRQSPHQRGMRWQVAGNHQQTGCQLVQAMDDPGARHRSQLRPVVQQGVLQGPARLPGTGMDRQASRLVDDQQVGILVNDLQRDRLGLHLGFRIGLVRNFQPQLLSELQRAAGAGLHLAIHLQAALTDPGLYPGPAVGTERAGQPAIQPLTGGRFGNINYEFFQGLLYTVRLVFQRVSGVLIRLVFIIMAAFTLHGCAGDGGELPSPNPFKPDANDRRIARADAQQLYRAGRKALDSGDFANALAFYSRLDASYPFTPEATQGQLEGIYARFRSFETEAAASAADRFLRAHPRHPHVDYVLYLRGLIHFESTATDILDLLDIESTGRDPVDARRSFEEFARLLQTYPDSKYAPDARARMVWLRERIAKHYFAIADYYRRRGAWVAAIRRGEEVLNEFRDTQVALDTLILLEESYRQLGLDEQADSMQKLIAANRARPLAKEPAAAPRAQAAPPAMPAKAAPEPAATPVKPEPAKSTETPTESTPASPQPRSRQPMVMPSMEPIVYPGN